MQGEVIDLNFSEEKDVQDTPSTEVQNEATIKTRLFPKQYRDLNSSSKEASAVWAFFEVNPDEDHIAVCKLPECKGNSRRVSRGNEVTGKRSWSTKGMWGHLRRYYEQEHASIYHMKQTFNGGVKKELKQLEGTPVPIR